MSDKTATVICEVRELWCPTCKYELRRFAVQQQLSEVDHFDDVEREEVTCHHCENSFCVSVQLDVRHDPERSYTQQKLFKCYQEDQND